MIKKIGGPWNKKEAEETARILGTNYLVIEDSGNFYVCQDDEKPSGKIFGYDSAEFLKRQYKPHRTGTPLRSRI